MKPLDEVCLLDMPREFSRRFSNTSSCYRCGSLAAFSSTRRLTNCWSLLAGRAVGYAFLLPATPTPTGAPNPAPRPAWYDQVRAPPEGHAVVLSNANNIPIGNHLILSGIPVTVNGVVLDIGYPAWLFERLPKEQEKKVSSPTPQAQPSIGKAASTPRSPPLGKAWWLKRPKEHAESGLTSSNESSARSPIVDVPTTCAKRTFAPSTTPLPAKKHRSRSVSYPETPFGANAPEVHGVPSANEGSRTVPAKATA